ncbi:hypothetical protein ABK040_012957 [Willaertia magna]
MISNQSQNSEDKVNEKIASPVVVHATNLSNLSDSNSSNTSPSTNLINNVSAPFILSHPQPIPPYIYDENNVISSTSSTSANSNTHLIEIQELKSPVESKYIDFNQALNYFLHHHNQSSSTTTNVTNKLTSDNLEVEEVCCFCFLRKNRVEALNSDRAEELKSLLNLTNVTFTYNNMIHVNLCLEIYYHLMKEEFENGIDTKEKNKEENEKEEKKPYINQKWENIGFLGPDLETEFRGIGIFGALMALSFVTCHKDITDKLFQLSKEDKKVFPFVICILHLLHSVMTFVKSGKLNKYINENESVLYTIQQLHANVCNEFYDLWSKGNFKETDFHHLIQYHSFKSFQSSRLKGLLKKKV